jgi:YidC/Oxa1 family membrane protein insertase
MASAPIQLLNLSQNLYTFIPAAALIPLNSKFLWMNLGLPEIATPLISIGTFAVPILTILVVITTWLQSKLMTPPSTTSGDQSAAMSNMMTLSMPVLMGFIAYSLSSGLALYFIISNILGVAQYAVMGNVHWSNLLPKGKVAKAK